MKTNSLLLAVTLISACSSKGSGGGSDNITKYPNSTGGKISEASLRDSLSGIGLIYDNFQTNDLSDSTAQEVLTAEKAGNIVPKDKAPITYARLEAIVSAIHTTFKGLGATKLPDTPPRIILVNNPVANAFMYSNTKTGVPYWGLFIFSGLLTKNESFRLKSDADISWVLAHEIAHASQMHHQRESFPTGNETRLRNYIDAHKLGIIQPLEQPQTSLLYHAFAGAVAANPGVCAQGPAAAAAATEWVTIYGKHPESIKEMSGKKYFMNADHNKEMVQETATKAGPLFAKLSTCRSSEVLKTIIEGAALFSLDRRAKILELVHGKSDVGLDDLAAIEAYFKSLTEEIKADTDLQTGEREADEVSAILNYHLGLKPSAEAVYCAPTLDLKIDELPTHPFLVQLRQGASYLSVDIDPHPDNCYRKAVGENIRRDLAQLTASGAYPRKDSVNNPLIEQSGGASLVPASDWDAMIAELKNL